jgi:ATP-dependent Clp protease ATP-binding subunit ClpA
MPIAPATITSTGQPVYLELHHPRVNLYVNGPSWNLVVAGSAMMGHVVAKEITQIVTASVFKRYQNTPTAKYFPLFVSGTVAVISVVSPEAGTVTFLFLIVGYVLLTLRSPELGSARSSSTGLKSYMRDMVAEAKAGLFPRLTGYEHLVDQVEDRVFGDGLNGVVLTADAGVGKSTIPETIAYKLAFGEFSADSSLANARLIGIDTTSLVGGTRLVGDLEERIEEMKALAAKDPSVVFWVDEVHQLIGAGAALGAENRSVADMLLAALARPGFRFIGATTQKDYLRYIAGKPLGRRLPPMNVPAPSEPLCFKMLRFRYADERRDKEVKVSDSAIKAAIFFTRGIPENLPDKAVQLLAAALSTAKQWNRKNRGNLIDRIDLKHVAEAYAADRESNFVHQAFDKYRQARTPAQLEEAFNAFVVQNSTYFNPPQASL